MDAAQGRLQGQHLTHGGYGSSFKPVNQRTPTAYTNDQTESSLTIQSAISQALAEARQDHMKMITLQQDAHRKEIEHLTTAFQTQLKALEANIQKGNNHPVERIEYLEDKLERSSNQMDACLDKIINLLLLSHAPPEGPSPFRKKTRHETEDTTNMEIDHFDQLSTDKELIPSRNSPITADLNKQPTTRADVIHTQAQQANHQPIDETQQSADNNTREPEVTPKLQERDSSNKSPQATPPPLPDSPGKDDSTWLKRKTSAAKELNEKAKTLLNPYRTARGAMLAQTPRNQLSLLNQPIASQGVHLTNLSSSRGDTASLGRED